MKRLRVESYESTDEAIRCSRWRGTNKRIRKRKREKGDEDEDEEERNFQFRI